MSSSFIGRDPQTEKDVEAVFQVVQDNPKMSLVGDADFLWFLSNSERKAELQEQLKAFKHRALITPNVVEF